MTRSTWLSISYFLHIYIYFTIQMAIAIKLASCVHIHIGHDGHRYGFVDGSHISTEMEATCLE